jgi:hypothetical protein
MKVRHWAEFTSDLPEDHIEDDEEIIQYGGKSVAEAIGGMLKDLGCEVDPPVYAHEHGWEIDARCGKRRLWGQVTLIEGYIFAFEDTSWIAKLLSRPHPVYLDVLTRLADALAADKRFHNVGWYFDSDLLSGEPGAARPVEA